MLMVGKSVGNWLTVRAATEHGLEPGTPFGSSVIDMFAELPAPLPCLFRTLMAECK
jgi:ribulose kinase